MAAKVIALLWSVFEMKANYVDDGDQRWLRASGDGTGKGLILRALGSEKWNLTAGPMSRQVRRENEDCVNSIISEQHLDETGSDRFNQAMWGWRDLKGRKRPTAALHQHLMDLADAFIQSDLHCIYL